MYFPLVLFIMIYKVVLNFQSMNNFLKYSNSRAETCRLLGLKQPYLLLQSSVFHLQLQRRDRNRKKQEDEKELYISYKMIL